MGHVYLGRSPGGHHVAIKAIRPELAADADFRIRFAREVHAARMVNAIFTAPVVDADVNGPVPWLATSYIPGPSLADAVASGGPLSAGSVLTLAAGLAEGLLAIHAAGIVHRDLKPSNVILAEDGPRLIDFGISRSAQMSALTHTGMVLGSPGFMSPEQAEGREVGPPSDIFSLGAVLAFAATGHGPYGAGTSFELLDRVVHADPDTHDLPAGIGPLIERCLAKDPLRRPTASQLLAELSGATVTRQTAPAAHGMPGPMPERATARPVAAAPLATREEAAPGQHQGGYQTWAPTVTTPPWQPAYRGQADTTTARHRRRRPYRSWLLGFAAVIAAAAAAAVIVAWRAGYLTGGGAPAVLGSSPAVTHSSQPQDAATMTALGSYLAQSATVRPAVQPAIDGVLSCAQTPSSGQAAIQNAIETRQHILTGLQGLSPGGLPNGAQLISTLTSAMRDSVTADQYFQGWMADFASAGSPCGSSPSQNPNYAAGQQASAQATVDKNAFVSIWNPLAPSYGQRTYSATGF